MFVVGVVNKINVIICLVRSGCLDLGGCVIKHWVEQKE